MKRKIFLLAALLSGLLFTAAVQASPMMFLKQLFGIGMMEVPTQQTEPRSLQEPQGGPEHDGIGQPGGPIGDPPHEAEAGYGKFT